MPLIVGDTPAGVTPTPADVVAFLGPGSTAAVEAMTERAATHLPIVTSMARAYTRDRGFTPAGQPHQDVAHVIIASTARLVSNPRMLTEDSHAIDDASGTERMTPFTGWTLPELAVLNRYRKRAL